MWDRGSVPRIGTSIVLATAMLLLCKVGAADENPQEEWSHQELRKMRAHSLNTRRELHISVVSAGVSSIVGGVVLAIPDDFDLGLRYAGMNTIAFGVVNTIVGSVALYGIDSERHTWEETFTPKTRAERLRYREHALADESREARGHALNLGLAGAYAAIGGMAITVSQLDVAHPNRWLGSGIAISAQAVHLAVIDLVGTLSAGCYERRMREVAPVFFYDPLRGETTAQLSYQTAF